MHAVVAGIGVAGFACADQLVHLGARVTVVDAADGERQRERADVLGVVGATVRLGDGDTLPQEADVLVVSPGLPPSAPIILAAQTQGVPVWGELELAWRLRGENPAAWLMVTGTNGKTTTTLMLESILRAAGLRTASVGNIGVSLVDAVMDPNGFDVFAVEVGAPQLPFLHSASPVASVCLNLAPDHVDLFGSYDAYRTAKARIYSNTQIAAVYNVQDPETEKMVEEADVVEGCRAIGFTLGMPGRSMMGVVEDILVDRAFIENRADAALELGSVELVKPFAPHNVANALAAAALARAYGVPATAVAEGLTSFQAAGHRIATVADHDGIRWVDDSKATNCHAAQTSLLAYESVVWIAGGMAKGQEFDELVQLTGSRMRGVVLLGVDREKIREAFVRHAPDVPIAEVLRTDTGAMDDVVLAAAAMATAGDTVLLAPGCASWDMFRDYAHRGDAFADSINRLVLS
ncbi:MAG: UDP-N-acetylmuramoyl-L-alanine--D-glutamate ligase [Actinomycetes bacterium]